MNRIQDSCYRVFYAVSRIGYKGLYAADNGRYHGFNSVPDSGDYCMDSVHHIRNDILYRVENGRNDCPYCIDNRFYDGFYHVPGSSQKVLNRCDHRHNCIFDSVPDGREDC